MKRLLLFLALLFFGVLLFGFVAKSVGWQELWTAAGKFWGREGAFLLLLTFAALFMGVVRWREILRHQGYNVPLLSLAKQYFGGFSLSFFAPMAFFGAELFRSYSLSEFHSVPFQRGMVSVAIERILEGTMYLLAAAAGVAYLLFVHGSSIPPVLSWALFGVLAGAVLLTLFYIRSHKKESIARVFFPRLKDTNGFLEMEKELFSFFKMKNPAFWEGLALSAAKVSLAVLRTFVVVQLLGTSLGFLPILTITGFSFVSLLVFIPGQLGVHEALQAAVFQAFQSPPAEGAAFAFLVRAAELAAALVGLAYFLRLGALLFSRRFVSRIQKLVQSAL